MRGRPQIGPGQPEWVLNASTGESGGAANGYCELAADCGALPSAFGHPRKFSMLKYRTRPLPAPAVAGGASSHAFAAAISACRPG